MDGGRAGWGLEGHGVIVTGAGQGIGEATARAFAASASLPLPDSVRA